MPGNASTFKRSPLYQYQMTADTAGTMSTKPWYRSKGKITANQEREKHRIIFTVLAENRGYAAGMDVVPVGAFERKLLLWNIMTKERLCKTFP